MQESRTGRQSRGSRSHRASEVGPQ